MSSEYRRIETNTGRMRFDDLGNTTVREPPANSAALAD